MTIPADYYERVYAGVLGKIIGVYLGRPFEGWSYEKIIAELGEIQYYVHEKRGVPLVVTDDDISGTFTFLRAMPDYANNPALTPAQIGQTWLNYLIENKTVLWWGGNGNSTEHTAYLRLKSGMPAPHSGSIAANTRVVAEQIGAQIFIDGWAMIAPGDPERAADFARRAASVSHDGEAVYAAQLLAAMEALAFVEADLNRLLDTGLRLIPGNSLIYRMVSDIRAWHARLADWGAARRQIAAHYGYDRYGGGCHMIPNHALIQLALLYGQDDFQKAMRIVNTSGWDTDCNSGNVGCLMGIKNGLAGLEGGPDWRGPVADRMFLPTADGGRAISDAVFETTQIVNIGRSLAGLARVAPKNGARFHFELPGSVQGFQSAAGPGIEPLALENTPFQSGSGTRALALRYPALNPGRAAKALTPTFIPADMSAIPGYMLVASPALYPGQTVQAELAAAPGNASPVSARLCSSVYRAGDQLEALCGPALELAPGQARLLQWTLPDTAGDPLAEIGIELSASPAGGTVWLNFLSWQGMADVTLTRPAHSGSMWSKAWVNGLDSQGHHDWSEPGRMIQNRGRGLLIQGCREWTDYRVCADFTPHMIRAGGLAARVQGMERYYALLLCPNGMARLVKCLDGETVLAEAPFAWEVQHTYQLELVLAGRRVTGSIDGQVLFNIVDENRPLEGGAVGLVCEEGRLGVQMVRIRP